MRLDKYLCNSTDLCQRRARAAIAAGEVRVSGTIITDSATQVHEHNGISWLDRPLRLRPSRYIMLHKPKGSLCSHQDGAYPSLFNWLEIDKAENLHLVGRLDADTSGLVLFTDDGRWSYQITRPEHHCRKIYRVGLRNELASDVARQFANGIMLQGEASPTQPADVVQIDTKEVLLTLTEGRFHQVKRMFAAVGNKVVSLHREHIGHLSLDVGPGQWRHLTTDEVTGFYFNPAATD
ncbi:ribosomal small subunit pseudouridine synthase A [Oceanisphaera marina]|uniref:Pseudouridine synthase n=1 Tax=Oceanisphaera marina TaxID=2017550 RepID=A0ABQ1IH01_9GAMM|nr:pseudouridine synthase [Oceanisphaera marina]GGB40197.1 ribosomal small subunit pseudouridine synthase A [Oceanisphaera marina]